MKEFDRESFPDDPELKPLYANLRRIGIGQYLCTETFDQLIVELKFDDDWYSCLNHCGVNRLSGALEYEEPFYLLINIFYADLSVKEAFNFIAKIILDFLQWNTTPLDIRKVCESMKELDIDEELIKKLTAQARKITKNKTKSPSTSIGDNRHDSKVFIIHGHDEVSRLKLEKLLTGFNLKPIILQDEPGESLQTIISKFESKARNCMTAIALFTPDDEMKNEPSRPRQNVILELGYFMGRDQQTDRKIIILKKKGTEGPSDINGVETINFEKSIDEVSMKLQNQLKHWKIIK